MPDWTKSMSQDFEYYIVDPRTWKDKSKLDNVTSCSISRDSSVETLGSATIDINESVGEEYIRAYMITIQNGVKEKHPLGTFLVQTPSTSFDGMVRKVSMDAYTPLIELKEKNMPLGYSILKNSNIMDNAYEIAYENMRAPIVKASSDAKLYYDFVASSEDTNLTFLIDLISNAKFILELDEMGRVLFAPKQELSSLQPVWTFDDSNSSILYPDITMSHDLYGIPNVVEVIYSENNDFYYSRIVNDDENSPTSTINRGREIIKRIINPSDIGNPTQKQIDDYATLALESLSKVEYSITYTHGYCPVRLGDCVRLNYKAAGIENVRAKVIKQDIKCEPGCTVSETAIFTARLWGNKYGFI